MVAFVIFWAAAFAIIFFAIGSVFKAMASVFSALMSSLAILISLIFLTGAAILVLFLIYGITDGIIHGSLGDMIVIIVLAVIVLGFILAIFGGLGAAIIELVFFVVTFVLDLVNAVLNWVADLFERGYIRSLKTIINQLEKC